MATDDVQRSALSIGGGIVKPTSARKIPPLAKVRTLLLRCLKENDFTMVEALASLFRRGHYDCEYKSMKLLAQCYEKMGQQEKGRYCQLAAERYKRRVRGDINSVVKKDDVNAQPPRAGRTVRVTPPRTESNVQGEADMDVDMKEEDNKIEIEEEEPLDPIDYARKLDDIIQRPSVTEEVIISSMKNPIYERFENQSQTEMTVKLRLPLTRLPGKKKVVNHYLTAQGKARMTSKDVQGGDRAYCNAKGRAAKQAINKVVDMCNKIEDAAKVNLQRSIDSWFSGLRRDEYVDRCYQAFKRARDFVFGSAHDGLYSAKVFLYGSATTGLVLGDSDIDVAVALPLPKASDNPRHMHAEMLGFLRNGVDKTMGDVELITTVKVPVLRYYDPDAKIDVDITIASENSVLLSRLLRTHLKDDIRIWELCMAVKYWARRRRVSGALQGYINPMGWIVMVIYFLQHHVTPRIGTLYKTKGHDPAHAVIKQVPWSIPRGHGNSVAKTGELLLQFFKFFGYEFDFANKAISINMQYPERVQTLTRREHGGPIFIEQPLEHGVNVVDYVKASNMAVIMTELRQGYVLCKTRGDGSELFKVRNKSIEDRLFD